MANRAKAIKQSKKDQRRRLLIITGSVLSLLVSAIWALPVLADDPVVANGTDKNADTAPVEMGCADVPVPWVPGALELDDAQIEKRHRAPIESPAGDTGCTTT